MRNVSDRAFLKDSEVRNVINSVTLLRFLTVRRWIMAVSLYAPRFCARGRCALSEEGTPRGGTRPTSGWGAGRETVVTLTIRRHERWTSAF